MDRIDAMRLFVRLAERGSFSAAAREQRIKQSTASKWIAELEEQLGVTLLERTTRAMRLTAAGVLFRERAVEIVGGYDALSSELSQRSGAPMGRVRLSAPVVFGRLFVVPALLPFLREHTRIEMEIVLADRYVNLVDEGFDVAVRVGVPVDSSARGRKLADGRRVLVASPDYVRLNGQPETPSQLKSHQCILHGDVSAASSWRFQGASGTERPVSVRGRITANNSEAALDLVRAGLGVGLLADWLVREDLATHRLLRLLEDYEPSGAPVFVLTPPGRRLSSAVHAVVAHLGTTLTKRALRGHAHG